MNCILAFERRRQTNFLRRANIGSRFRFKHLSHRYMEHKKKRCILAKDSTASLKGLESVTWYWFGWTALCFREWVNKWYHQRQLMFFHLQFSSEVLLLAVWLKQQFDLSSTLGSIDAIPPQKKQKSKTKQNKIQSLSNLRYFWIAYRFCYDERCENEQ